MKIKPKLIPFIVVGVPIHDLDYINKMDKFFIDRNVPTRAVRGYYNGVPEASLIMKDTPYYRSVAETFLVMHNQESMIVVDTDRNAKLVYNPAIGTEKALGKWAVIGDTRLNNWPIFNPPDCTIKDEIAYGIEEVSV